MEKLSVTYSKIILNTLGIRIPLQEDPDELVAIAMTKSFNLYGPDPITGERVVVDQVNVHEILKALIKLEQMEVTPDLLVGDQVKANYRGEEKQGAITSIGYKVEGCGNKFYSSAELERIK